MASASITPRGLERVGKGVRFHRLQGLAGLGLLVAVVDGEDGAALQRDLAGDALHGVGGRGRELKDFAGEGAVHGFGGGGLGDGRGRQAERPDVVFEADETLVPAVVGLDELLDGQGVEELVGDHENGVFADGVDVARPIGRVGAEALLLLAL
jgi:hypothetical protein